jgi:ATP-binding protein involved in chromosome partitioning
LRKNCGCALCIDEWTGKKVLDESKIDKDVFPHKIEPKGKYAVAIMWSDGHNSSIYPYTKLLSKDIPSKI